MDNDQQCRIIRYSQKGYETKIPVMPMLIVLRDGTIGEAKTITGLVALIIGEKYLDSENALDEWNYRMEAARNEAMKALENGIYAVAYDLKKGIIEYNYAADPEDPDYEIEEDTPPIKIIISSEKLFILTLMKLGAITVYEREDSSNICVCESMQGEDSLKEYKGGVYVDIAKEYNLDSLIEKEISLIK